MWFLLLFSVFGVSVNFSFKRLVGVQTQAITERCPGHLLFMFLRGKYFLSVAFT